MFNIIINNRLGLPSISANRYNGLRGLVKKYEGVSVVFTTNDAEQNILAAYWCSKDFARAEYGHQYSHRVDSIPLVRAIVKSGSSGIPVNSGLFQIRTLQPSEGSLSYLTTTMRQPDNLSKFISLVEQHKIHNSPTGKHRLEILAASNEKRSYGNIKIRCSKKFLDAEETADGYVKNFACPHEKFIKTYLVGPNKTLHISIPGGNYSDVFTAPLVAAGSQGVAFK